MSWHEQYYLLFGSALVEGSLRDNFGSELEVGLQICDLVALGKASLRLELTLPRNLPIQYFLVVVDPSSRVTFSVMNS